MQRRHAPPDRRTDDTWDGDYEQLLDAGAKPEQRRGDPEAGQYEPLAGTPTERPSTADGAPVSTWLPARGRSPVDPVRDANPTVCRPPGGDEPARRCV